MLTNLADVAAAAWLTVSQAAQALALVAAIVLAVVLVFGAVRWVTRQHRAGMARLAAHAEREATRTSARR